MGYTQREISVTALLSSHNSERDAEHETLWADLCAQIARICAEPKYEPIVVVTVGAGDVPGG